MKPDEIIVLVLTFLTGVVAGGFLYVMVYAPQYTQAPVEERSTFSVTGEQYGGCQLGDSCASFRLEGDATYQYLVDNERIEGALPVQLYDDFAALVNESRLQSHAAPADKEDCAAFVDGIDYRYDILFEDTRYRLDTCRTSLSYGSELQQSLLAIWEYLGDPEAQSQYPVLLEEGIAGWLQSRLRAE